MWRRHSAARTPHPSSLPAPRTCRWRGRRWLPSPPTAWTRRWSPTLEWRGCTGCSPSSHASPPRTRGRGRGCGGRARQRRRRLGGGAGGGGADEYRVRGGVSRDHSAARPGRQLLTGARRGRHRQRVRCGLPGAACAALAGPAGDRVSVPVVESLLVERLADLEARLRGLGSVLVAFSGGADSAFLLAAAVRALGTERVVAATAVSPSLPAAELVRLPPSPPGSGCATRRRAPVSWPGLATPPTGATGARTARASCSTCPTLSRFLSLATVVTGTNADDARGPAPPGYRGGGRARGGGTPARGGADQTAGARRLTRLGSPHRRQAGGCVPREPRRLRPTGHGQAARSGRGGRAPRCAR